MKNNIGIYLARVAALAAAATLSSGCAAFRAKVSHVDPEEERHLQANYDYTDMRKITEDVAGELMSDEIISAATAPPLLVIMGVENRTTQYVDTKALTDRIRTIMIQADKAKFVNESRRDELLKEQSYQSAQATPETQTAVGKQLGAKWMLTGSLIEMETQTMKQARVSKKVIKYYKLTMELTNLETGIIDWTTEKEFAREASKPIIGW